MSLLAIDIGNTNTVLGYFDRKQLKKTWRVASSPGALKTLSSKLPHVDQVIVSSVVPSLKKSISSLSQKLSKKSPLMVTHRLKTPIRIAIKNKKQIGADRIVNAVAAHARWKTNLIIVDLGTATTFDVVTKEGVYLGGIIAPGIGISRDALAEKCAQLPRVKIQKPSKTIGRSTVEAMQSGLFLGYVALIDGLVEKIKKEFKKPVKVIATGGLSPLLFQHSKTIDVVDHDLTLKGLHWIQKINSSK